MTIKPESTFIRGVHTYVKPRVYKMKNHNAYVGGIPDCWYSGFGNDLWVEYKYLPVKLPRSVVIPKLSPQQFRWIKERKKEGRHVWVIVGCQSGGVIYHTLDEMEFGLKPEEFKARLLSRKQLADRIYKFCNTRSQHATTECSTQF